jgi:hypothetical protein
MRVYEGIESGAECERFSPIVEALACGEATSKQVLAIRPHLRHCSACRAAVRDLHLSRLRRASLLTAIFARDVSGCAYSATLARVPGGDVTEPPAGRITVASGGGPNVIVKTFDTAGNPQPLPFHLIVAC